MGFSRKREPSKDLSEELAQPTTVWSGESLLDVPRDEDDGEGRQSPAPSLETYESVQPSVPALPVDLGVDALESQRDDFGQPEEGEPQNGRSLQADEPRANAGVKLGLILDHLEYLRNAADDRHRYDEVRELQVRKLYDELDEYKRNAQLDRMLDLARGVMLVIDKLDPLNPFPIPLDHVREELLECLRSVGVEAMAAPVGDQDPLYEVVVGFLDSNFPQPSRIRQEGYLIGAQIIRKRLVEMRGLAQQ